MKSTILAALTMILGIALSTSAFAQGRHDEKAHGSGKPTAEANEQAGNPPMSGRHDEKAHGMKKPAAKNDCAKPAGGAHKGCK